MEVDQIRATTKPSRPCKHCRGSHWDDDCFKAKGGKAAGKMTTGKFGSKSNVSSGQATSWRVLESCGALRRPTSSGIRLPTSALRPTWTISTSRAP